MSSMEFSALATFQISAILESERTPEYNVIRVPAVPLSLVSVVAKQHEAYLVEFLTGFLVYFGIKRLKPFITFLQI